MGGGLEMRVKGYYQGVGVSSVSLDRFPYLVKSSEKSNNFLGTGSGLYTYLDFGKKTGGPGWSEQGWKEKVK